MAEDRDDDATPPGSRTLHASLEQGAFRIASNRFDAREADGIRNSRSHF